MVADRSPGWGLGSHAFVAGASASSRPTSATAAASSQKVAAGLVGPIGVELGVKFAWNKLDPVEHRFLTIPITIRGTLTF